MFKISISTISTSPVFAIGVGEVFIGSAFGASLFISFLGFYYLHIGLAILGKSFFSFGDILEIVVFVCKSFARGQKSVVQCFLQILEVLGFVYVKI